MPQPYVPPVNHSVDYTPSEQYVYDPVTVPVSRSSDTLLNGNSSNSVSNPTGVIQQESGIYNSQVNLKHDSYVGYGVGNSHPVPVFSGTMRWNPNYGDYEAVVGVHVPLGGRSSKYSKRRLLAATHKIEIENQFRAASGCANIARAGFVINYALLAPDNPLHQCKVLLASGNTIVIEEEQPSADELRGQWNFEAAKMRAIIERQQRQIDLLLREHGTKSNPRG